MGAQTGILALKECIKPYGRLPHPYGSSRMMGEIYESEPVPIIYPDDPIKCFLLTPPAGLGVPLIPCSRSYIDTLLSFTLRDWYSLLFTSEPFRESCETCPCHRCVDRDFLIWNGKDIRLTRYNVIGRVASVECFYRKMAIVKVCFHFFF